MPAGPDPTIAILNADATWFPTPPTERPGPFPPGSADGRRAHAIRVSLAASVSDARLDVGFFAVMIRHDGRSRTPDRSGRHAAQVHAGHARARRRGAVRRC